MEKSVLWFLLLALMIGLHACKGGKTNNNWIALLGGNGGSAAVSSGVIDISHGGTSGYDFGYRAADQAKRSQTFIAGRLARLDAVEVKIRKNSGTDAYNDISVELYETAGGLPTGDRIAETRIASSSLGTGFTIVSARFDSQPLVPGREYAIVLGQVGLADSNAGYQWCAAEAGSRLNFGRLDGSAWSDDSGNGDGWLKVYVSTAYKWSALDTGMTGLVRALAVDSVGNLYAGGSFITAGGTTVNRIAKWDGASWSALGEGMDGQVYALAVDASDNLYAAGDFATAGGTTASRIAMWDGTSWSALGDGFDVSSGYDSEMALAFDASGNLYAGGDFESAGGIPASHIAMWDGVSWSALDDGVTETVHALAFDSSGNLYAGGLFALASGTPAQHIAKWNGASWSALGDGTDYQVDTLVVDSSDNIYAGGLFTTAGGSSVNHIAMWDGGSWSALDTGLNEGSYGSVYSLVVDQFDNVYAGGYFTTAGGDTVNYIAQWNGTSWSSLGGGMDSSAGALALDPSGNLYAGGWFTAAGTVSANHVARWGRGTAGHNAPDSGVIDLSDSNGTAAFTFGYRADDQAKRFQTFNAAWYKKLDAVEVKIRKNNSGDVCNSVSVELYETGDDGLPLTRIAGTTIDSAALGIGFTVMRAELKYDKLVPGREYAVVLGQVGMAGTNHGFEWRAKEVSSTCGFGKMENSIWIDESGLGDGWLKLYVSNDNAWSAMGAGMNYAVYALAADSRGNVYAGGPFDYAGPVTVNSIAMWNGSSWSPMGSGYSGMGSVFALAVDSSDNLYAGGNFDTMGGIAAKGIARWNGHRWSALGEGIDGQVEAIAFDTHGNLYAGGSFTTAGGTTVNNIAMWDGHSWSALGGGVSGAVRSLAVDSSDNLYVGGHFENVAGIANADYIAMWNGVSWSALGTGMNYWGDVNGLALDSSGNLYAGGFFATAGGTPASRIAMWNGVSWSALGSGVNDSIYSLAIDPFDNIYVGGPFTTAGGTSANHVAMWNGSEWSSPGEGLSDYPDALAVDRSGNLYAGGWFTSAEGTIVNYIARWGR